MSKGIPTDNPMMSPRLFAVVYGLDGTTGGKGEIGSGTYYQILIFPDCIPVTKWLMFKVLSNTNI